MAYTPAWRGNDVLAVTHGVEPVPVHASLIGPNDWVYVQFWPTELADKQSDSM